MIANPVRLAWELGLHWRNFFALFYLALSWTVVGEDPSALVAVFFTLFTVWLVSTAEGDFARYRVLGLTRRMWWRQGHIPAVCFGAASIAVGWRAGEPLVVAALCAALAWRLLRRTPQGKPESDAAEELVKGSEGSTSFGRFPVELYSQLVTGPIVRSWIWVWAVCLVVTVIAILYHELSGSGSYAASVITGLGAAAALFAFRDERASLRQTITLGGTRRKWATKAAVAQLACPAIGALMAGVAWVYLGEFSDLVLLPLYVALALPPAMVSLNLFGRRTLVLCLGSIVAAAVYVVAAIAIPRPRGAGARPLRGVESRVGRNRTPHQSLQSWP